MEKTITIQRNRGCCVCFQYLKRNGCLPIEIYRRSEAEEIGFPGGIIEVHNSISSQFVSALLIASPLANEPVELRLLDLETRSNGKVRAVSEPYIDMTIEMMKIFGIQVEKLRPGVYRIPTGQRVECRLCEAFTN